MPDKSMPRKHLFIYIAITIVAIAGGIATQPIIDFFRRMLQHH